jgi:hypothetical protein
MWVMYWFVGRNKLDEAESIPSPIPIIPAIPVDPPVLCGDIVTVVVHVRREL